MAHNEEKTINGLLSDLQGQTIFSLPSVECHVHVVANACKDQTARAARQGMDQLLEKNPNALGIVHELAAAGKANAWNEFMHVLASKDSEFVILLDADIRLVDNGTLELLLKALRNDPSAHVSTDVPVRDISLKESKTLTDKIILALSASNRETTDAICGQLYCGRYSFLKKFVLPLGLPVEDGFLRAMVLTDGLEAGEKAGRIINVSQARHVYKSPSNPKDVFHHQVRIVLGTAINTELFAHLRNQMLGEPALDAYIRMRNQSEPDWINSVVADKIKTDGPYSMGLSTFKWRVLRFISLKPLQKLIYFPVYLAILLLDLLVFLRANWLLWKGSGAGFW
jgi:hypothetical protein